ncbi:FAD-dependent oxidoreductase [Streptomyces sp. MUM 203J]|uniref:FAD-dependent oxidoreductase n=1 Tax=Streptomyces sp. MUM 203J TaxID=2791990 RepID=UPI001F04FD1C|nr:FAD-dependent oxidoreductase [Streptomyces sp. MUM 203J]MCH0539974.1 FAD-dependent oxidoreductase [Streptomyces sp. MUM 203J]
MLRVAVVGSGPSGVYTAQSLVEQTAVPDVRVHVLDRLPCPYGLVRYGVAPDHEKIKSLQNNLRAVLEHERVRFIGNVPVGEGALTPARLLELYHAVVYCVGAARDRRLGIPGEDLTGSCSATDFVAWYSAHPDAWARRFALDTVRSAVVVGAGNVAVDVTRILARAPEELRPTDVPAAALEALAASTVREVHMVARRGPSQGRFTTKELRELGTLPSAGVALTEADLALDPAYGDPTGLPAVNRRNVEVIRGWATSSGAEQGAGTRDPGGGHAPGAEPDPGTGRVIRLRFFLRPVEILGAGGRVAGVRFERTLPDGAGGVRGTGTYEEIAAGLVLRAVGYRGAPPEGLPSDPARGTVPHAAGRVLRGGTPSPGEYVAGWIKRGPSGVIGTNRPCAKETAASVLADAHLLARRAVAPDPLDAMRSWGLRPVEWPGWLAIERAEAALGRALGRDRVKIPDWEGLLAAAGSSA